MRKLAFFLLLSFNVIFSQNESNKLVSDSEIDSLVNEADAVVLEDNRIVTVDDSKIEYHIKRKIRINNKDGKKYGRVVVHESEFSRVTDIESTIKDIFGNVVKELEENDIEEITYSSGYTEKAKSFNAISNNYPFIIEYSFIYEYDSHFFWPDWKPQKDIPVLSSSYKLIFEDDVPYKTHKIGLNFEPIKYEEDGDKVHLYTAKNIPPLDEESYLPKEYKVQNAILFTPINFQLGKTKGSFKSWDDFAKWIRYLYKDCYYLPENIVKEIKDLVGPEDDPYKKIEILYKYLQDKTRYVAIYLDIGGWQPHSSEWVYNNRFGDCKDLATLMTTMLKITGIESYPAIVRTKDSGHVLKEFPSNQFNHVITFIPLKEDTLWVDCTLDFVSCKDIPYSLEGTNALVVKENKGDLIRIPQRSAKSNSHRSLIKGKLDRKGKFVINGEIIFSGNIKNQYQYEVALLKSDELKRSVLKDFIRYQPNFSLDNFSYQQENSADPLKLEFSGQYKNFSKKVGKRLFLNPNFLNRETQNYVPDEAERDYPFDMVKYPHLVIDSLGIELPKDYIIESAPDMKNIVYPFGKYITKYKIENGIFYYKRLFEYSVELIYPEEFETFLEFYKTAVETDKSRFVFKEI